MTERHPVRMREVRVTFVPAATTVVELRILCRGTTSEG